MSSVWWDHSNIISFDFSNCNNCNQAFNANLYTQQLQCVHKNFQRKHDALVSRRNIELLNDNVRPHSERITQEKVLDLGWSVLPHPVPNDFHFFHSLQKLKMTKDFLAQLDGAVEYTDCFSTER